MHWESEQVFIGPYAIEAGALSDPFLMAGFDKKVVHLAHTFDREAAFDVEVDFMGSGDWKTYRVILVDGSGFAHHEFPGGFSAHWVRVRARTECTATVAFMYN